LRRSLLAGAILDGIVAASLAVMASAALGLARAAIVDGKTAALGLAAAALLLGTRVNPAWLVLGAGLLGMLWKGFG
jgi:chromate transporter